MRWRLKKLQHRLRRQEINYLTTHHVRIRREIPKVQMFLKNSIFGFHGGAPTSNLSFEVNDVLDHEQWQNSIISGWSASLNNSIESTEDARAEPEVISESSECVLSPGRRGGGGGCHSCDHCFRRDNYSDGLRLRSNGLADAKDRPKQWVQCMLPAHSQLPLSQRALWLVTGAHIVPALSSLE